MGVGRKKRYHQGCTVGLGGVGRKKRYHQGCAVGVGVGVGVVGPVTASDKVFRPTRPVLLLLNTAPTEYVPVAVGIPVIRQVIVAGWV